jgi:hypothetical protein
MEGCGDPSERYFRLASQGAEAVQPNVERLAAIKSPPAIFANQAIVTTGPRQVKSGLPSHVARGALASCGDVPPCRE